MGRTVSRLTKAKKVRARGDIHGYTLTVRIADVYSHGAKGLGSKVRTGGVYIEVHPSYQYAQAKYYEWFSRIVLCSISLLYFLTPALVSLAKD